VHQAWRHRAGLDTDLRVGAGMAPDNPLNLFRARRALTSPKTHPGIIDNTDSRRLLRYIQSNKIAHLQPPMVQATGLSRPDRGTIGASSDHRDYPMSTHGDEPTTPAIAWNGRNGALNGPNADGVALGPRKWPLSAGADLQSFRRERAGLTHCGLQSG